MLTPPWTCVLGEAATCWDRSLASVANSDDFRDKSVMNIFVFREHSGYHLWSFEVLSLVPRNRSKGFMRTLMNSCPNNYLVLRQKQAVTTGPPCAYGEQPQLLYHRYCYCVFETGSLPGLELTTKARLVWPMSPRDGLSLLSQHQH